MKKLKTFDSFINESKSKDKGWTNSPDESKKLFKKFFSIFNNFFDDISMTNYDKKELKELFIDNTMSNLRVPVRGRGGSIKYISKSEVVDDLLDNLREFMCSTLKLEVTDGSGKLHKTRYIIKFDKDKDELKKQIMDIL